MVYAEISAVLMSVHALRSAQHQVGAEDARTA